MASKITKQLLLHV